MSHLCTVCQDKDLPCGVSHTTLYIANQNIVIPESLLQINSINTQENFIEYHIIKRSDGAGTYDTACSGTNRTSADLDFYIGVLH